MAQPHSQTLRIAMLNADMLVPTIEPIYPTHGRIFHTLLSQASKSQKDAPPTDIQSTDFDVKNFEYPTSLDSFDALIISGSGSSSYDAEPWITQLSAYIKHVYATYPRVKIYGSCFGHQIVCSSLLDLLVEQDPKGGAIGVRSMTFDEDFLATFPFPRTIGPDRLREWKEGKGVRLQFIHHDHVVLSALTSCPSTTCLPTSWMSVGRAEHCVVQGVYQPGRVFTLQGHFEFDRLVNGEVVKHFYGKSWEAARLREALSDIDQDDDAGEVAEMVLAFLLEKWPERDEKYGFGAGLLMPLGED